MTTTSKHPDFHTLRNELIAALKEAIGALEKTNTDDEFNYILDVLGGMPGLIRVQLGRSATHLGDVVTMLKGTQARMAQLVRRSSTTMRTPSVPPPAPAPAVQAFRNVGDAAARATAKLLEPPNR